MKAFLQLVVDFAPTDVDGDDEVLIIKLKIRSAEYSLWYSSVLDDSNKDAYYTELENAINELSILKNSTELPLVIDDNVYMVGENFDTGTEGVVSYLNALLMGM